MRAYIIFHYLDIVRPVERIALLRQHVALLATCILKHYCHVSFWYTSPDLVTGDVFLIIMTLENELMKEVRNML